MTGLDRPGLFGLLVLVAITLACGLSIPWTFGSAADDAAQRFAAGDAATRGFLPPVWVEPAPDSFARLMSGLSEAEVERIAEANDLTPLGVRSVTQATDDAALLTDVRAAQQRPLLGTDLLGRSLLVRLLAGGTISLGIGLAASVIAVTIGTIYGSVAGYIGGRTDAVMMRIVDVLFGLPYVLLVVLLAVAADGIMDRPGFSAWMDQAGLGRGPVQIITLLVAIGGVSWLTMARVIRGEVLSLKTRPFIEAARAAGAGPVWIFRKHLLPALVGPIVVYATLTAPQAVLQESFLSFLGIGVQPPMPSWGSLAADGLGELNNHRSRWWLLLFPSLALGVTLLSLNLVGESLRRALDPKAISR